MIVADRMTNVRATAPKAPVMCAWCMGAGKYLEAWLGTRNHVWVRCENCDGKGRVDG